MATPPKKTNNQQNKQSVRTNTGQVAVVPLNKMYAADVKAGMNKINSWLKKNTKDYVDLNTIKSVAGSLPVIGNAIALVDAVYDVIDISKKPNPGFGDWLNLGLDVIGIIPVPPTMATMRMSLRPTLNLVRQKAGGVISDTILVILSDHLNERIAGELDQFAAKAQPLVKDMMQHCGTKITSISNDFANGIQKILNGHVFSSAGNVKQAQKQLNKVNLDNLQRNPKATFNNAVDGLTNLWKASVKENINTVAKGVSSVVPASAKQPIQLVITGIRGFGKKAPQFLMTLADPGKAMSIAWLLNVLLKAVQKFKLKKKATANITQKQVAKKEKSRPSGELEKTNHQAKAKNNPNEGRIQT